MPRIEHTEVELLAAIDALTRPNYVKVDHAGRTTTRREPSLWEQLLVPAKMAGSGGGKPGSRPPVALQALSLVTEIESTVSDRIGTLVGAAKKTLAANGLSPMLVASSASGEVPADLRLVQMLLRGRPTSISKFSTAVHSWCDQAKLVLGMLAQRTPLPIGTKCMNCGSSSAAYYQDSESVTRPALLLVWTEEDKIDYIYCQACGWSGEPDAIYALSEFQVLAQFGKVLDSEVVLAVIRWAVAGAFQETHAMALDRARSRLQQLLADPVLLNVFHFVLDISRQSAERQ